MKDLKNILRGDYSDPSILRVGQDYYIVTSSFQHAPALTIWHSANLFDWEPVCHAVEGYTGDVFAPDLCYYEGRFYIYYPAGYDTNYVVYADDIHGPWSKPIDLHLQQIDPGHCVGEDGKRYLYLSKGKCVRLADDGLSVEEDLGFRYDGWEIPESMEVECPALEGPKFIQKNGYFYMLSAMGGTAGPATSHMVIAARSKSILGPWENAPNNPIVHTESADEKWWSQGHGTMFDTPEGDWYIVYHGYEKGYHTLGRQALISKIVWTEDDWFYAEEIENHDQYDEARSVFVDFNDDLKAEKLKWQWKFQYAYDIDRLQFTSDGLVMQGKGETLAQTVPLLVAPYSNSYEVTVMVESHGAQAGLCLYYNKMCYCYVGADAEALYSGTMIHARKIPCAQAAAQTYFKIRNNRNIVTFYYSLDGEQWNKLIPIRDVTGFQHNTFGDFISLRAGLYALGEGTATFRDFTYQHLE